MAGNKPLGNMIINLSMDGTQFSNTLDGIRSQIKQAQSAMKANLSVLGDAGDEYETLSAKVKGLNEIMAANSKQIELLREKHRQAIETYGEGSKEVARLATQINNAITKQGAWERQLQQSKSRLEELDRSNNQFAERLGEIGSKFQDVQKKATSWSGTLAKVFTAPLAAVGAISTKFSSEIADITGQIQAMTGATSREAKKQGNIVGQVWADGFGESIDQVGEAVIKIKQNLKGIDDKQLKSVTEKALTLSKITGADLEESLRGINGLMTNFGMSANEAFDYMVKGAQRGLNKSGELEDNIAEYSQLWAQNGFSAKEMFAILDNGLKSGAYNFDKVNDFVKEFGISLTDGRFEQNIGKFSKGTQELFQKFKEGKATTKDVFNSAINDLKNMKNQQDKLTLASNLWSALGEDNAMKVIESLNNTNKAYDNVKGSMDKATKAMNSTPTAQFQKAWRGVQDDLKPVGDTILNIATSALPKVGNFIKTIMQPLQNMSPTMQMVTLSIAGILASLSGLILIGGTIAGSVGNIIGLLERLAFAMGETSIAGGILSGAMAVLTSPITLTIGAIALLAGGFILAYKKIKPFHDLVNSIGSAIKGALEKVKTFASGIFQMFKGDTAKGVDILHKLGLSPQMIQKIVSIVGTVKSVFTSLKNTASSVFSVISGSVKKGMSYVTQSIGSGLKSVLSWWKSIFPQLKTVLSAVFKAIKVIIGTVLFPAFLLIKSALGALSNSWKNIWHTMTSVLKLAFDAIKTVVKVGWDLISGVFSIFLDLLTGKWKKAWTDLKSMVMNIMKDLWKGLKNVGKDILKVFENLGKSIANGLLGGLANGVNGIIDGINWVLKKVGAKDHLLKHWKVPHYAKGTDNHPGGLAVVSDGVGKNKQELITLPNGQMFLSPKEETVLPLPKGTSVLNGDATAELLNMLPKYADGTGWLQNAWDKMKSFGKKSIEVVKDVWSYASNPKKLLTLAISKYTDLSSLRGTALNIIKGTMSMVVDKATNWIKQFFFADNPPGSGVQRWRPYVIRALEMNGLSTSESMIQKVLRQIATESGGNPRAVQHGYTDINTIRGDLAKGLMQTISATFNAYKFPGHDNIFNGFDNLLAALNYAKHRYGKNLTGLGEGHGYANGGIVANEQIARIAEGNKPEAIIPLTKRARALQLLAKTQQILGVPNGGTVVVNNDYSEIVARQDQQITMMQKQIELLTQLLLKDTTIEVDGREIAKATAKYTQEELDRNKLNQSRARGRVSF